jgi:carbon starvation protein CstA
MTRVRGLILLSLAYLGLLAYIWFDAVSNGWGWGWALFGTLNVTVAALALLGLTWLVARVVRRTRR